MNDITMDLSSFSLANKVALVTGGGSGIGKMIACALASAGAFVWIVNRKNYNKTLKQITNMGAQASALSADITNPKAVQNMLKKIYTQSEKIDILVNAAGMNPRLPADKTTLEVWQKTIDINLTAPYYLSKLVIEKMRQNRWGRIINLASLQSVRAFANSIPYGASKGGIMQLTRALAQAHSKEGILINAIAPGFFHTALTDSIFQNQEKSKQMADKTMLGRNGLEQDLFGISVFLASDANTYITGQTLFLDGGFSAQ